MPTRVPFFWSSAAVPVTWMPFCCSACAIKPDQSTPPAPFKVLPWPPPQT